MESQALDRRDARAQTLIAAALEEFKAKGYAAARLDDVARRAGVAKGTLYLYFDSKEALFKAVVRSAILPAIERAEGAAAASDGSAADLLRQLVRTATRDIVESDGREVLRLLIGEAGRFPDLADFYYEEVVQRAMAAVRGIVARGVASGEFRRTALDAMPQAVVAPLILAAVWKTLFERRHPLDAAALVELHLDLTLDGLRACEP
jgi:AcrR family transcriptional regulator